jgi:hypothetical protein
MCCPSTSTKVAPLHLDEKVAALHPDKLGVKLTALSAAQSNYLNLPRSGPYKPSTIGIDHRMHPAPRLLARVEAHGNQAGIGLAVSPRSRRAPVAPWWRLVPFLPAHRPKPARRTPSFAPDHLPISPTSPPAPTAAKSARRATVEGIIGKQSDLPGSGIYRER